MVSSKDTSWIRTNFPGLDYEAWLRDAAIPPPQNRAELTPIVPVDMECVYNECASDAELLFERTKQLMPGTAPRERVTAWPWTQLPLGNRPAQSGPGRQREVAQWINLHVTRLLLALEDEPSYPGDLKRALERVRDLCVAIYDAPSS